MFVQMFKKKMIATGSDRSRYNWFEPFHFWLDCSGNCGSCYISFFRVASWKYRQSMGNSLQSAFIITTLGRWRNRALSVNSPSNAPNNFHCTISLARHRHDINASTGSNVFLLNFLWFFGLISVAPLAFMAFYSLAFSHIINFPFTHRCPHYVCAPSTPAQRVEAL